MSTEKAIHDWVQGFDPWKRDLFLRAAATVELTAKDVQEVTAMLLEDKGAPKPREVKLEDLPGASDGHLPMTINRISALKNVNAIDDEQVLNFAPSSINIIYGANGAGKTGYCRILNHAGRSLRETKVLSNVEAKSAGPPSAKVAISVDGSPDEFTLDLSQPPVPVLGRLCCADGEAGKVYLTKATEVDYAPASLQSVSRLVDGLREVEAELNRRADLARPAPLELTMYGQTEVGRFLGALTHSSTAQEIDALATLSEAELAKREQLRKESGEIDAQNAPKLKLSAEREADTAQLLKDALSDAAKRLDQEQLAALGSARKDVADHSEAADAAAKAFDDEPLSEVGSDQWRLLWAAAREFAAHREEDFPSDHDEARCPLCQQRLKPEAAERLGRFDQFVTSNIEAKLQEAKKLEQTILSRLPDVSQIRLAHSAALGYLPSDSGQVGSSVATYLDDTQRAVEELRQGKAADGLAAPPVSALEAFIDKSRADAKKHAELEEVEDQKKVRDELAELDARFRLSEQRATLIDHLNKLVEVDKYEAAKSETGTNAVSRKITALSRTLIEADLQGALNRQLDALGFDGLEVVAVPQTKAGEPAVRLKFKTVANIPLTDVLSQGEQRRLALAMFLAEMEVLPGGNPVLLDDPTSSIDQEGRKSIARTLVKLAETRQVIIFTHEMSFVYEVQRKAKKVGLEIQHLLRIGKSTGHVQDSLPWEGLAPGKRTSFLEAELKELKKTKEEKHPDEYARGVISFCGRMRQAFERTVEDRVLFGVVTRREDDVHTKKLRKINCSPEICDLVDEGMDENSPWLHDKAVADGSAPPTITELQQGIDIYKALQKKLGEMENPPSKKQASLKPAEPPKPSDQGALALELVPEPPEETDNP